MARRRSSSHPMHSTAYSTNVEKVAALSTVTRWDSLLDFLTYAKDLPAGCGEGSPARAAAYVLAGATPEQQRPALELLDRIDAATHGRKARRTVATVSAGRPCVPVYLTGRPDCFRRSMRVPMDRAPLRLYVEVSVSGGISDTQLAQRGAAVAALAMRLTELRPVELYACWNSGPTWDHTAKRYAGAVRIDTQPLSMAHAVAVLARSEFTRALRFAVLSRQDRRMDYAVVSNYTEAHRAEVMRRVFDMAPQDIYIPGGSLHEGNEFMRDPVAWVNKYLDPQRELPTYAE